MRRRMTIRVNISPNIVTSCLSWVPKILNSKRHIESRFAAREGRLG